MGCQNGGTCKELQNEFWPFKCECPAPYEGHLCEIECKDQIDKCAGYVNRGYCTQQHVEYMRNNCVKSCGFCGGEIVDGQWSEWSTWSECSKSCDGGEATRTRYCNNPSPSGGGSDCAGDSQQTQDCNVEDCPVDGEWSEWSSWSSCTKTCGGGEATRTRECNNPTPTIGGSDCDGNSQDIQECMVEACTDSGYETCVESKELACHLKGGVKSYPGLESKQMCEEKCDEEERCNFIIWQDEGWCLIYETCDEYRETDTIGSIYAKNSCPPQQDLCHNIKIETKSWGHENSYELGSCSSQQRYGSYENYEEECCQPSGTYTLECMCSYGDGWHGGYIEIDGTRYCDDFTAGYSENVTVSFA